MHLNEQAIAAVLDGIRAQRGGFPLLQFAYDDWRIRTFRVCSNYGMPAVDRGQSRDCRWSLPTGQSLHAHWHDNARIVRFHLDQRDPRRYPAGHLAADTCVPEGVAIGGGAGFLAGLALGASRGGIAGAIVGGLVGAVAGGTIGSRVPRGTPSVWKLLWYRSRRDWKASSV